MGRRGVVFLRIAETTPGRHGALKVAILILLAIAALIGIDLLAPRYGVDSRATIGDDRARSIGI